ncbi:hypothetical protein [Vagococcus penaei]
MRNPIALVNSTKLKTSLQLTHEKFTYFHDNHAKMKMDLLSINEGDDRMAKNRVVAPFLKPIAILTISVGISTTTAVFDSQSYKAPKSNKTEQTVSTTQPSDNLKKEEDQVTGDTGNQSNDTTQQSNNNRNNTETTTNTSGSNTPETTGTQEIPKKDDTTTSNTNGTQNNNNGNAENNGDAFLEEETNQNNANKTTQKETPDKQQKEAGGN